MATDSVGRVALVFRGDRTTQNAIEPRKSRLGPVVDALAEVGISADAAAFSEDAVDEVRDQLLGVDGVLVWVDPVTGNEDRSTLDALLRDVASAGVWVSAHPDVVLRMGTKEVLFQTRELGWGSDTYVYRSVEEFEAQFPKRIAVGSARVLKQFRGNGGIGVQKVELIAERTLAGDAVVRVQYARTRSEETEDIALGEFMRRCKKYFAYSDGAGRLIDQPFQPRITEGIIRCYMVKGEVVGFARQYPSGYSDADAATVGTVFGLPSDKTMFAATEPTFAGLRTRVESEWVPAMQALVGVDAASLPALWDADFLFGPKDDSGDDTYILCEINVSAVLPFPPEAPRRLAQTVLAAVQSAQSRHSEVH